MAPRAPASRRRPAAADSGWPVTAAPPLRSRPGPATAALLPPATAASAAAKPACSPAHGPPQDARRSAEVEGAPGGVGVVPLVQEALVLHLLAHQTARDDNLLAADDHLRGGTARETRSGTGCSPGAAGHARRQPWSERGARGVMGPTIWWPLRTCLAMMEARRPSMCPRASITTACAPGSDRSAPAPCGAPFAAPGAENGPFCGRARAAADLRHLACPCNSSRCRKRGRERARLGLIGRCEKRL